MTNLKKLFSKNPVFSVLGETTQDALIDTAISRQLEKDEWAAYNGDVWPYLFMIEAGSIAAIKESQEGRSLHAARFYAGELFWGLAFFQEDAPTPAGLIAEEPSRIHLWSRETMLPILLENGQMSWELTCLMIERMLLASEIVEGLAFHPVAGRLADWLLKQSKNAAGSVIAREMTLDDIAAQIGSTRVMVCRILYRFADEGAVQINRTEFNITDFNVLEHYVNKE